MTTSPLTISQLARYAGVTVRAVRHYHAVGLLPEPDRDASGYRRYGAQHLVDLIRIATLAGAGVPLARVGELLVASHEEIAGAVTEIDRDLQQRIAELQRRRRDVAALAEASVTLWLPPRAEPIIAVLRGLGVSDRMLRLERDAWILLAAAFPEQLQEMIDWRLATLADPDYASLAVDYDACFAWEATDPRLPAIADRTVAQIERLYREGGQPAESTGVADSDLYRMTTDFQSDVSPAWQRLIRLVNERLDALGMPREWQAGN